MEIVRNICIYNGRQIIYYGYLDSNENFIMHREDGPAAFWENGKADWWINDCDVSNEVEEWLRQHGIEDYKDMTKEDKLALVFFMRSLI